MKKRIDGFNCDSLGMVVYTVNDKNVFYLQDESNKHCDIYIRTTFGSFFNGDLMVKKIGETEAHRVSKIKQDNGSDEYYLLDKRGEVPLEKLEYGIPCLDKSKCPSAPFVKSMLCMSYYFVAKHFGVSELELEKYSKLYNECLETNASRQAGDKQSEQTPKRTDEQSSDFDELGAPKEKDLHATKVDETHTEEMVK